MNKEWSVVPLRELVERVTTKNDRDIDRVLTVSAVHGLVMQESFFTKRVASKNLEMYFVVEPGDYVYNKSYSNGYPIGVVRRNIDSVPGVVSPLYIVLRLKPNICIDDWLDLAFESRVYAESLQGSLKEGGRAHGLLNIKLGDYFSALIPVPPLSTQHRIVDLMAHLDNHLRNLREERDAFGLLETSFLDETFEESQETFYLGDIADVFDCEHKTAGRASKGEVVYGYSIGTRDIKDGIINIENAKEVTLSTWEQWSRRIEINVNDILMSREAPVGSVGQVLGEDSLCLGQRTVAIRAHGEFEPSYLAAALRSRRVQSWMAERSSGLTVAHLNVAEIKRMPVPKVLDVERRKMISHVALNFIRSRKLIAQELESLTRYRRSLLSGLLSGEVTVEANYDALLTEVA